MKIFCIFPASVLFQTIAKISQASVVRTTSKYLPAISIWINKRFIELANRNERICLVIYCRCVHIN